jgi:hypothetical protein
MMLLRLLPCLCCPHCLCHVLQGPLTSTPWLDLPLPPAMQVNIDIIVHYDLAYQRLQPPPRAALAPAGDVEVLPGGLPGGLPACRPRC